MSGASQEQALTLIASAKSQGDLSVHSRLSLLKQAKEVIRSLDSSSVSELIQSIAELQSSPEILIRKCLVEMIEEFGLKALKQSLTFMPTLWEMLNDNAPAVIRQSIVAGANLLCRVFNELAMQSRQANMVERWLEDLWTWVGKIKDSVCRIASEPGSIGTRLLAFKFVEVYTILLTSVDADFGISSVKNGSYAFLNPSQLTQEASQMVGLFLNLLNSTSSLQGSLIIGIINCLAGIARKKPYHFSAVLTALLEFDSNVGTQRSAHQLSIQFSLRTAFLGFLRCSHPIILESRERLIDALRAMNAGDAADQVIRHANKISRNSDCASRFVRVTRDESASSPMSSPMEQKKEKSVIVGNDGFKKFGEAPAKRPRVTMSKDSENGISLKAPMFSGPFSASEQMIAMIGALLGEGERGFQSLEILISNIQPDLMADIVITNMKDLPPCPSPLSAGHGNIPPTSEGGQTLLQVTSGASAVQVSSQPLASDASANENNMANSDSYNSNFSAEPNRDPRRDPRRVDPRRPAASVGMPLACSNLDEVKEVHPKHDNLSLLCNLQSPASVATRDHTGELEAVVRSAPLVSAGTVAGEIETLNEIEEDLASSYTTTDNIMSPTCCIDKGQIMTPSLSVGTSIQFVEATNVPHADQPSSAACSMDETFRELPISPAYIELTNDDCLNMSNLVIKQIAKSYEKIRLTCSRHDWQSILARLVAENRAVDDVITTLQKHIIEESQSQKGHELSVHILYHLHALVICKSGEDSSCFTTCYETILLAVAKSARDLLPASDKTLSRLLNEAPFLPDAALTLLEDLCHGGHGTDGREGDRITQGLGALWNLIVVRPSIRHACLDIILKCTVDVQDDVRAKAVRLVANKLYLLDYASEFIEQFATSMLLSVVDQDIAGKASSIHQNVGDGGILMTDSLSSEVVLSENDTTKEIHSAEQAEPAVSLSRAQCSMSLFFALSSKKPALLRHVFDIYGGSAKAVRQVIHRHIPVLIRNLQGPHDELVHVIANAPQGSENLLILVLEVLTEDRAPSHDLIASVKHLYETKMKNAAILIPLLSSLPKNEVIPIFPKLVGLPLEKFQAALARILQGSAHTGPALTPVEVLVAIHDINPDKDDIPLKKITDACSACFEQRIVFTQQVLLKSLNHLVEKTPLPLLFMRTVIQAVDAFPALVDFVMEILSKLVAKQIWRMPKLWIGFLKCAAQTAPHSFSVLLKLPAPQLENFLSKYSNLKGALAAYANHPSIQTSLPRSSLAALGGSNEAQRRSFVAPALQTTDTSSVPSTALL